MRLRHLRGVTTLALAVDKCRGCGMCTIVCPQGVFTVADKHAVITDRDACMECGACAGNCAHGAVTVRAGVGCAAAILKGALTGAEPVCECGGPQAPPCC